jgi:hypothetical protein
MKKIIKSLKSLNPYIVASCVIVGVSALVIFALIKEEAPPQEKDSLVIEESIVSAENEIENDVPYKNVQVEVFESKPVELEESVEQPLDIDVETEIEIIGEKEPANEKVSTSEESVDFREDKYQESIQKPEDVKESESKEPEVVEQTEILPEVSEEVPVEPESPPQESVTVPEVVEPAPEEPKHEHSWMFESYYQEPTCSNGGLVNEICAQCGETQITGGTPTGEHSYVTETIGDCCSSEVIVCTECNNREVKEKDPTNHIDVEDGFCYGCGHSTE